MSPVMLFYKDVQVLSRDEHRDLRLKGSEGFDFAANTHWLPVAGTEFASACRSYPIVFVSEGSGADEKITAILLVGLQQGSNDYVDNEKHWHPGAYLPAFVRRYPFALAVPGPNDEGGKGDFMVCFDASFAGFNMEEGAHIFNEDGTASELLEGVVEFMNGFQNDLAETKKFVDELRRLDLLERRSAEVRGSNGRLFKVDDILVVNEKKFNELSDAEVGKLHRQHYMGWIYAHLMSLSNLPLLVDLHRGKKGE
ncbi:SapC family protein [Microvirga sp. W0021]|uniref:SapC family protein n=1 Tax=Hohaiivirga grylli TaxID=3133970 RepID=A0ABV0BI25_9HYPH